MSKYFQPDSSFGEEAQCAICMNIWNDPVEVCGCEHIFCRQCITGLKVCPTCMQPFTLVNPTNAAIRRMLMRLHGSCSTCPWTGTYKEYSERHTQCLQDGETPGPTSPIEHSLNTRELTPDLADYYVTGEGEAEALPTAEANLPPLSRCRGGAGSSSTFSYVPSVARDGRGGGGCLLPSAEGNRWRQQVSLTARDYGLSDAEFNSLLDNFLDFATVVPGHADEPRLRWRDAFRLLRFYNYPSHSDDVENLFLSAGESTADGAVSFHALCVWVPLNRRNVPQSYAMDIESYNDLLAVAQLLDMEKTGLFTLEQCLLMGEHYFERDISESEWEQLVTVLRRREEMMWEAYVSSRLRGGYEAPVRVSTNLKLPLHEVLISFAGHVDSLRMAPGGNPDVIQRLVRLVQLYDPAAVSGMLNSLPNWAGDEESLLATLISVYGPEPT